MTSIWRAQMRVTWKAEKVTHVDKGKRENKRKEKNKSPVEFLPLPVAGEEDGEVMSAESS